MRLPASKVYRAFRELDRFTDEQCGWYVRRAIRKHAISMAFMGSVGTALGGLVFGIVGALAVLIGRAIEDGNVHNWMVYHSLAETMLIGVFIAIPAGAGLVTWLWVRDRWLRWAIRRELRRSTCPKCEYQLLGLRVDAGTVRCPECGLQTRLDLLNLDCRMTAFGDASWNVCSSCRYPWGGLPLVGESVVRPECGKTHSRPQSAIAAGPESIKCEPT